MPLVEKKLPTFLEHLSSPPVSSGIRVVQSLVLPVVICRSLFVLLSIVLSALLRFTASDYPYGSSNLSFFLRFLCNVLWTIASSVFRFAATYFLSLYLQPFLTLHTCLCIYCIVQISSKLITSFQNVLFRQS
jgi:hypothetical protein